LGSLSDGGGATNRFGATFGGAGNNDAFGATSLSATLTEGAVFSATAISALGNLGLLFSTVGAVNCFGAILGGGGGNAVSTRATTVGAGTSIFISGKSTGFQMICFCYWAFGAVAITVRGAVILPRGSGVFPTCCSGAASNGFFGGL
jgi:hypothetical protein